jgi:hypothetical protein
MEPMLKWSLRSSIDLMLGTSMPVGKTRPPQLLCKLSNLTGRAGRIPGGIDTMWSLMDNCIAAAKSAAAPNTIQNNF